MSDLSRRVASLEDGAPGPCPECAHDPSARVVYKIVWEGDSDTPLESSPPCGRCGNQSTVAVDWEDETSERHSYGGERSNVPDYPPWSDEGGG